MIDQYTEAANDALEMIREAGKSYPIKRVVTVANPVEGTVTETVTEGTLVAIILPASKGTIEAFDNRLAEGLRQEKLRYIIAAAKGAAFTPDGGDVMTFEGASWSVLGCTPLAPAGIPVIFKLGVKQV